MNFHHESKLLSDWLYSQIRLHGLTTAIEAEHKTRLNKMCDRFSEWLRTEGAAPTCCLWTTLIPRGANQKYKCNVS